MSEELYPGTYPPTRKQMFISGKEMRLQHGWLGKLTPGSTGSHSTGPEPVAATLEKRFG